jgi:predicted phosphoribosyltransferase
LAIVASVSVAAPASATEQVLLVQSAPKSTVKLLENNTVSIFMRSQAQPFAAVAERPRRLVIEVPKRDAVALWDKSFGEIAP